MVVLQLCCVGVEFLVDCRKSNSIIVDEEKISVMKKNFMYELLFKLNKKLIIIAWFDFVWNSKRRLYKYFGFVVYIGDGGIHEIIPFVGNMPFPTVVFKIEF